MARPKPKFDAAPTLAALAAGEGQRRAKMTMAEQDAESRARLAERREGARLTRARIAAVELARRFQQLATLAADQWTDEAIEAVEQVAALLDGRDPHKRPGWQAVAAEVRRRADAGLLGDEREWFEAHMEGRESAADQWRAAVDACRRNRGLFAAVRALCSALGVPCNATVDTMRRETRKLRSQSRTKP